MGQSPIDSPPTAPPQPAAPGDSRPDSLGLFAFRYGPWAVVTGASDGIGRDMAQQAAARGRNVVLVARRGGRLSELATEIQSQHGVETRIVAADLGTPEGLEAVEVATADLDVGLLAAAAGFGTSGPFLSTALDDELAMLDVNCGAVLTLSHRFARRFVDRGRGGLVLLSSIVAFQGVPRAAHYAATKAWVQTLAEGLRHELAPHGVDVLASAPGPVASGFADRADMVMDGALDPSLIGGATLDALGRSGTVRPGWLSKVLGYSLATLPRFARTRIMTAVMHGMTRHQAERNGAGGHPRSAPAAAGKSS
ncbi:MAG: SDR family NAD(P)-dependent oxidoreductase [Acidobacteriota bacterium]